MTRQLVMAEERMAKQRKQGGFTLTEVLIATVILVVCLVAIAQLVPASILSNSANRNDSSAMVFAEQEMNQFVNQPLANLQYTTDTVLNMCTTTSPCLLGNPTQAGVTVGNPVVVINNSPVIDFSNANPVAGYSFLYQDPNDPTGTVYDVRWAVIAQGPTGLTSKRFILGVTKRGGNSFFVPVTLDTMVVR